MPNAMDRFIATARKPWWGPHTPSKYMYQRKDGSKVGVGLLGQNDYASFNLWLFANGRPPPSILASEVAAVQSVAAFLVCRVFTTVEVEQYALGEWALLMPHQDFKEFMAHRNVNAKHQGRVYELKDSCFRKFLTCPSKP